MMSLGQAVSRRERLVTALLLPMLSSVADVGRLVHQCDTLGQAHFRESVPATALLLPGGGRRFD